MKILIAEDDKTSGFLLQTLLEDHGVVDIAENGQDAVEAVRQALENDDPYDLICLDIMMPEEDGQSALRRIRALEYEKDIIVDHAVKIVMVTALNDMKNISDAIDGAADAYIRKPISRDELSRILTGLGFPPLG